MQDEYVTFETAKLLKEKGFNEHLSIFYTDDKNIRFDSRGVDNYGECFVAPTLQMAMKWLREEHNIFIGILYNESEVYTYTWSVLWIGKRQHPTFGFCNDYGEAVEAAIKYCLENLI